MLQVVAALIVQFQAVLIDGNGKAALVIAAALRRGVGHFTECRVSLCKRGELLRLSALVNKALCAGDNDFHL